MGKFVIYTREGERVFGFKEYFTDRKEVMEIADRHNDEVMEFEDDVEEFPKWLKKWPWEE